MQYDDRYKKVNEDGTNGGMFRSSETGCCVVCQKPTLWIEPTWLLFICSDECYSELCKSYKDDLSKGLFQYDEEGVDDE